jgi:hypothetical protein
MMTPKLRRTLFDAIDAVEAAGGRYAIVGGLAVGTWAVPRATRDVDLYTDLDRDGRSRLAGELQSRGFHVPAMEEELQQFGVFRSRSNDGVFVDVFDSAGPLGEAILANRRQANLAGRAVWFVSATELAALKAFSDRPRDFDDLSALVSSRDVDQEALDAWARELDESVGTDEISARVKDARRARKARK